MICLDADVLKQCFEDRIFAIFDGGDNKKNLSAHCRELLTEQIKTWHDLRKAYEFLKNIKIRDLPCKGFSVRIQHNPGRVKSSTANVDNARINSRPCFLCLQNLPEAQKGILYRRTYLILCNPAPVFPSHLTIVLLDHHPQSILDNIDTFLNLSRDLGNRWTILYNGPKCGASAPDHLHFQAIPSGLLPIEKEILEEKNLTQVRTSENVSIFLTKNLGREAITIEGHDTTAIADELIEILTNMKKMPQADEEPMINVACFYDNERYRLLVFPRARHRPEAFFKEGNERIVVSPAVIEMCGVIVTPAEKDFERLDAPTVEGIYREVSLLRSVV